jgi:hypothetical protein
VLSVLFVLLRHFQLMRTPYRTNLRARRGADRD